MHIYVDFNPIYITIGTHLCVPDIGTLALVNISFGMYLAHIVFINSLDGKHPF